MENSELTVIFLALLFFAPVFMGAILFILSNLSGWRELAAIYPYSNQEVVKKKFMQSLSLRFGVAYRSCVTIGASPGGLYFAVMFPFSFLHPRIFIPWTDIRIYRRTKSLWNRAGIELEFERESSIHMTIYDSQEDLLEGLRGHG